MKKDGCGVYQDITDDVGSRIQIIKEMRGALQEIGELLKYATTYR